MNACIGMIKFLSTEIGLFRGCVRYKESGGIRYVQMISIYVSAASRRVQMTLIRRHIQQLINLYRELIVILMYIRNGYLKA